MNGASTPTPPSGSTILLSRPVVKKKKAAVNPLVKPKQRKPLASGIPTRTAPAEPGVKSKGAPSATTPHQSKPENPSVPSKTAPDYGGWSTPAAPGTTEYPIYISKKALRENLRYHVMRMQTVGGRQVDVSDPNDFPRPLHLYRRDISAPSISEIKARKERKLNVKEEGTVTDQNVELKEIARQQREAQDEQRKLNEQQIAPNPDAGKPKIKKNQFMKAYKNQATAEGRAESNSMYEENLPWHLENDQGSINYVASHQSALSHLHVALLPDPAGRAAFHMVPVEKWYRFKEQPKKFRTFTSEEAEKLMKGKVKMPKWFVRNQEVAQTKRETEREEGATAMFSKSKVKREGAGSDAEEVGGQDAGDVDFEEDRFQDDEENELFEGDDDDKKEAKEKMEKEQLQANIFGLNDEGRVDQAEAEKKKRKEDAKKQKRRVERALEEYEGQDDYRSDASSRPSWGSSESDEEPETDEELGKTNKKRKSDELEIIIPGDQSEKEEPSTKKQKVGLGAKANARAVSTSSAPKGAVGALRKDAGRKPLTSSDNATSGGSGTDSPRKRPKKSVLGPNRAAPTGTGTSTPNLPRVHSPAFSQASRADSPPVPTDNEQRKGSILKLSMGSSTGLSNGKRPNAAGSGSDSDNMPLAKRAKTNKIRLVNPRAAMDGHTGDSRMSTNEPSPNPSRASSPKAGSRSPAAAARSSPASPRRSPTGSKAGSPATRPALGNAAKSPSYTPATQVPSRVGSPANVPIGATAPPTTELTPREFLVLIPREGTIALTQVLETLKPRVKKSAGPMAQKNKKLVSEFLRKYTELLDDAKTLRRLPNVPDSGIM